MYRFASNLSLYILFCGSIPSFATVFANVHGVVHDPAHHPIVGAEVTLLASDSAFTIRTRTNADGEFELRSAPLGVYTLKISATGFATAQQHLIVHSGTNPIVHIPLDIPSATQTVVVSSVDTSVFAADTATPTTLITRQDIDQTPGASRAIGMEMITDYVPGAYMTHDMLHMRGGHQTSWLIDGIAIPNTKIASNVGPQIDPKDIDSLETQRGSYASDVGDRTYGVFNVLPRNGFEYDRDGEFLLTGGNFGTGGAQLSIGDHSSSTGWYASLTGGRSSYGLATPVAFVYHDATNSQSAFASLIRNQTSKDQLRINVQYRQDHFDVPYDPSLTDWESISGYYASYGLRDAQTERDSFIIANWVHTISPKVLFSVSPFYHFNQANYDSLSTDMPASTTWHQGSNYAGGQADTYLTAGPNSFSAGAYSFYQVENDLFGVQVNEGSAASQQNTPGDASAALGEFYLSDHLRLGHSVTLLGGERFSFYRGGYQGATSEAAIYPRLGATVEIPRLHWVLRGFYGHFFQPAPLLTVSSSVLAYAGSLGGGENTFTPIPSERDEEHQFGIQIPYKGWSLDIDTVKNRVNNFLDHSNLGESNMYFPIAVDGALVRAWEMTVRSPPLAHLGQLHVTYANQIAEQRGKIVGGFTCSDPNDQACNAGTFSYSPVDHDQRNTLNTGFTAVLPMHTWFSTNVYNGSGFSNGLACAPVSSCPVNNGPYAGPYLPAHTTFDVSTGHTFSERWKVAVNVINVTNHRVLLDNSITIGGFHYNDPRLISGELRYRFHF